MRLSYLFASMAGLATMGVSDLTDHEMPDRDWRFRGHSSHVRAGKTYPHSNTRQRARYARQIAAGQLKMEGVSNG